MELFIFARFHVRAGMVSMIRNCSISIRVGSTRPRSTFTRNYPARANLWSEWRVQLTILLRRPGQRDWVKA